jgi:hypothetical protein
VKIGSHHDFQKIEMMKLMVMTEMISALLNHVVLSGVNCEIYFTGKEIKI